MATLTANISASAPLATLSAPVSATPGDLFRLGSEMVKFLGYRTPLDPRLLNQAKVILERGVRGTARASHSTGVTLEGPFEATLTADEEAALDANTTLNAANAVASMGDLPSPASPDLSGDTGTATAPPSIAIEGAGGASVAVTQAGGAGTAATVEVTAGGVGTQAADVGAAGTPEQIIAAMRASGLMAQPPVALTFDQDPTNALVHAGAVNEIQRITGGGTIEGGTWDTAGGPWGSLTSIPWDVDAVALQVLIDLLLEQIGDVLVSGGPLASTPFEFEYAGSYASEDIPELIVDAANLTGTNPTLTPSTVQEGSPAVGIIAPAVTVQVLDDLDAVCTHDNVTQITVALTTPGGATLAGTLTQTVVAGVATFDDLAVDTAGTYTLDAMSGALTPDTSASFDITEPES
jgi:hypothetical protein